MGIDNFLLTNRDIESRGIRFGGLLQRKRFAMTKKIKALRNDFSFSVTARNDNDESVHKRNDKKMSSLFDEVFITKIKGSHQKKRKALI